MSYDDGVGTRERRGGGGAKATLIPSPWRPAERVFDWAAKQGLTPAWGEARVDEFVAYWSDRGQRRKSWDATFIQRLQHLRANAAKGQDHEPQYPLGRTAGTAGSAVLGGKG